MSDDKKRSTHAVLMRWIYGLLTLFGVFLAAAAWSGIPQMPGQRVIPTFVIAGMITILLLVMVLCISARIINPDKKKQRTGRSV
ncbi:hypothetical protein [Clostridium sp. C105KSO13]|uniref:hypothetical protein n=1 Tax=Clostridium sp. C105KSO13 TaxID=1776045 RepID=UPI0007408002|nr:hypothetical protein [Clostridium sp. C105KSO13]CUX30950.1 hypothetical protein BN3456_01283 [Clostridium sp. C105KSO13]